MNRGPFTIVVMFLVVALVVGGCTSSSPQGRMLAEGDQVEMLAGTWKGTFLNASTNRSGLIELTLAAGSELTSGDVRLQTPSREEVYQLQDGELPGSSSPVRPLGLKISFMRFSNGKIHGALEPYEDPVSRSIVVTTFEGVLRDGVIEGTFCTRGAGLRSIPTGSWSVVHVSSR